MSRSTNTFESQISSLSATAGEISALDADRLPSRADADLARVAMVGSPSDIMHKLHDLHLINDKPAETSNPVAKPDAPKIKPPRLDRFNESMEPADHFRNFTPAVTGTGRVNVGKDGDTPTQRDEIAKKNLLGLVEKMHPGITNEADDTPAERESALRAAAKKTRIVELRTYDDPGFKNNPKVLQSNNEEMQAEINGSKALGIDRKNFPMHSQERATQTPDKLDDIVDWIHKETQAGNMVDIHCYHGTDRTGLVGAAYRANYDPDINKLVKADFDKAYDALKHTMLDHGVDPATHGKLYQSLRQYLQHVHDESNGKPDADKALVADIPQVAIANDAAQQTALQTAGLALEKEASLDSYKKILDGTIDKFDPATHDAFYRQLYHKFNQEYIKQRSGN